MAKKEPALEGPVICTLTCPVCQRSFQSEVATGVCTGVATIEERDENGDLVVTEVLSEDGRVIASVKHYKAEHDAVLMEVT